MRDFSILTSSTDSISTLSYFYVCRFFLTFLGLESMTSSSDSMKVLAFCLFYATFLVGLDLEITTCSEILSDCSEDDFSSERDYSSDE